MENTNLAEFIEDDEPFTLGCEPLRERRGRKPDHESTRFNEALWRIANGKCDIGGICHELAVITGLAPDTIRSRISSIEYGPEPIEPGTGLNSDDLKYFGRLYKNHKSAECREWFQSISGGQRRDPDRENARVKRQRITTKDGTHLVSLAIDPERN